MCECVPVCLTKLSFTLSRITLRDCHACVRICIFPGEEGLKHPGRSTASSLELRLLAVLLPGCLSPSSPGKMRRLHHPSWLQTAVHGPGHEVFRWPGWLHVACGANAAQNVWTSACSKPLTRKQWHRTDCQHPATPFEAFWARLAPSSNLQLQVLGGVLLYPPTIKHDKPRKCRFQWEIRLSSSITVLLL